MTPDWPRKPGSYGLVLYLPRKADLVVGKVGTIKFKKGFYLYVGSAFGPGGLGARLQRHLATEKKKHWHIDYLRARAKVKEVWMDSAHSNQEHLWAQHLLAETTLCTPIHRFGSSDCFCRAHLFYFKRRPEASILPNHDVLVKFKTS